mgnify:CR=1 FL=1
MKKNVFSFALFLLLTVFFCAGDLAEPAVPVIASGTCGENLTWELDDTGTLTISGTGPMADGGNQSLWGDNYRLLVRNVVFPAGLTTIGKQAFCRCANLEKVSIPSGVNSIREGAFYNCSGLASVSIPDTVTSIGNRAFHMCQNLTSIVLPANLENIGTDALSGTSLRTVVIPNSLESIPENLFSNSIDDVFFTGTESEWYSLSGSRYVQGQVHYEYQCAAKQGTWGDLTWSLSANGELIISGTGTMNAFADQSNEAWLAHRIMIRSVELSESITSIGSYAFASCFGLTEITIPRQITAIGTGAFHDCSSLTRAVIPGRLSSISSYLFRGCSGLFSIRIPGSVTSIGDYAFDSCTHLSTVEYTGSEEDWETIQIGSCNDPLNTADKQYLNICEHILIEDRKSVV